MLITFIPTDLLMQKNPDVFLSYLKKKLKWIGEMNEISIIFHFGPNPIKTYQSQPNLDQIKNKIKILSIWPIFFKRNSLIYRVICLSNFFVPTEPSFPTKSCINSIYFNLPRDQFDFHRVRCRIKKIIIHLFRQFISISF